MATRRVGRYGESGTWLVGAGTAAFALAVYAIVVVGGGALLGHSGSPSLGLSVLATAIVALGIEPVRGRLRQLRASSPYDVLTRFTGPAEGAPAIHEVLPRMARVLAEGTGALRAEVWLRANVGDTLAASWPPGEVPLPATGPGIRTHEVRHRGEMLGRLALQERAGEPLTPLEEKLYADLASQAGLVLRNVRLSAELEERVREVSRRAEELRASRERIVDAHDLARRRLERDIHDGAQQHLVALIVNVRLAGTLAERDPRKAEAMLPGVRSAAVATIDTLQELSQGLYPRVLADSGLLGALRAATETSAIRVELVAKDVARYSRELEAAVYFCCLEALQNATKHSGADRIAVTLTGLVDSIELVVTDDGRGFQLDDVEVASGLANMRDRLEAVGGTLDVTSVPGEGTTVCARVAAAALPLGGGS